MDYRYCLEPAPALLYGKGVSGMKRLKISPLATLVSKPLHAFGVLPSCDGEAVAEKLRVSKSGP